MGIRVSIQVVKSVEPAGNVAPGTELLYTLNWSVTGDETAPNVTIVDAIPANTTFVACANSCSGTNPLTWSLGNQNPGASGSVSFSVTVNNPLNNGTQIVNSGSITDSSGLTRTSTVTNGITSAHDIQVVKSCLLYTSDAADERSSVDLGGRRIIKKKQTQRKHRM
mgnify:CR=1 FL=1